MSDETSNWLPTIRAFDPIVLEKKKARYINRTMPYRNANSIRCLKGRTYMNLSVIFNPEDSAEP